MNTDYKICLLKRWQSLKKIENGELTPVVLKEINFLPEFYSILEIDGNFYRVTALNLKERLVGVKKVRKLSIQLYQKEKQERT